LYHAGGVHRLRRVHPQRRRAYPRLATGAAAGRGERAHRDGDQQDAEQQDRERQHDRGARARPAGGGVGRVHDPRIFGAGEPAAGNAPRSRERGRRSAAV
jgi:hypothetical protein